MGALNYDVVVVGGGPAGCMAAKYAAKAGASTLIIEEDAAIGEPVQCAGLISTRALEESELRNRNSFINCEIKRAVVHSPSYELTLESPAQRAFAISRNIFDLELAKAAQKEGANIILDSKVKTVRKRDGEKKLTITTATTNGAKEIRAGVVIGADGVKSTVAQLAGLNVVRSSLSCAQIEGDYEIEDTFAEIFVGKTIAPGFFAWTIPLGAENRARIGLCIDRRFSTHSNPLLFLKRNLAEHPVMVKKYKGTIFSRTAGKIPIPVNAGLQGRRHKTVKMDKETGILLVGDAAAQIKPITGGGVYYGMRCGKIAGEIAAQACLRGDMKVLKDYERRWRNEIGNEIAFGLKVHRLRCVMSDRDFDTIVHTLSQSEILQRIKKEGDMDYPSIIFSELLTNPRLIKVMARNIPRYLYTK
ncbi:MAG TPA: NAD(P)/FAD-dependent oxidoreductase [Candidatus Bathyarchaeia archaeon]|nr:NAD(P)/FAD-dependent oxidoreductase [Candidatus Bathyarchaeia archaeon]